MNKATNLQACFDRLLQAARKSVAKTGDKELKKVVDTCYLTKDEAKAQDTQAALSRLARGKNYYDDVQRLLEQMVALDYSPKEIEQARRSPKLRRAYASKVLQWWMSPI